MYTLVDHTKSGKGYITLLLDGRRVCDFFPFAKDGSDEQFVRQQAGLIAETMNRTADPDSAR